MHLKCCYSSCKSDSKKSEPGIKFMPFPKPNKLPNISERWVHLHLCARTEFTVASINKYTYICSKHFPPGEVLNIKSNPTLEPYDARNIPNGREGISQSPHNLARKQKQMRNSLRSLLMVRKSRQNKNNFDLALGRRKRLEWSPPTARCYKLVCTGPEKMVSKM